MVASTQMPARMQSYRAIEKAELKRDWQAGWWKAGHEIYACGSDVGRLCMSTVAQLGITAVVCLGDGLALSAESRKDLGNMNIPVVDCEFHVQTKIWDRRDASADKTVEWWSDGFCTFPDP